MKTIQNSTTEIAVNTPNPLNNSPMPQAEVNYLEKISVNNPTRYTMRLERNNNKIKLIQEYRPKGQIHDFPVLTITRWDIKGRSFPKDTEPLEITIDGKQGKHYKHGYEGEIFIENPPIVIDYLKSWGQAYLTEEELYALFNNIKIN